MTTVDMGIVPTGKGGVAVILVAIPMTPGDVVVFVVVVPMSNVVGGCIGG